VSKWTWVVLGLATFVASGASVVAVVGLVEVDRVRDELAEVRGSIDVILDVPERIDSVERTVQSTADRAESAQDAADGALRALDATRSDLADVQDRLSLLEALPGSLTLGDVQAGLDSAQIVVPASSILVPFFCSGEFAYWDFFGLSC
jgi:hypothetical protein